MDVAPKTALDQRGDVAGVVNVGVGEDEGIHVPDLERQVAVALESLLPPPLEQTAVEQDVAPVDGEHVHRTGDGAHSTHEA